MMDIKISRKIKGKVLDSCIMPASTYSWFALIPTTAAIFARSSVTAGPTGYRTWLFTTAAKVDSSASPS